MWLSSLFTHNSLDKEKKDIKVKGIYTAGSFYPASKGELDKILIKCYKPYTKIRYYDNVSAVIVPHAGYNYSASIAASAIGRINPSMKYERIFIIGTSHNLYIDGASIENNYDYYDSPYGKVKIDINLCHQLIRHNSCFCYRPGVHLYEHCIDVQLPILMHHLKKMAPIVPIIMGSDSIHLIMDIGDALQPYFGGNNLFIISSDFSHYPSYKDAQIIDSLTAEAIKKCSLDDFYNAIVSNSKMRIPNFVTSACGKSAIAILLYMASKYNDVKVTHTGYINSGDCEPKRRDKVVGYHGFVFTRDSCQCEQPLLRLSAQEKKTLLAIARNTIERRFLLARAVPIEEWKLTENMKRKCGVFVTLIKNGKLRGCIGHFGYDVSLFHNVIDMAQASAFDDPRFHPLLPEEIENINIEISVLTPMRRIYDINEIKLGKHGIYIKKDGRSGTFLPNVACEMKWDKEELLSHCAHDKIGLTWDGWKNAELYVYETIVFRDFSINSFSP